MIHFYLSPDGVDDNAGTETSPWGTLHRAAERLAETRKVEREPEEAVIHLAPGVYRLNKTLVLGPEHAGEGDGVTICGSDKGGIACCGGRCCQ